MASAAENALRAMQESPKVFRDNLMVPAGSQTVRRFGEVVQPFQESDFAVLDPALKWLAGRGEQPEKRRFWIQRGRGHSKTTDAAIELTWLLLSAKHSISGICVAEDRDQALLLRKQMEDVARANPWLPHMLEYQVADVRNPRTGAALKFLSNDPKSLWGITPDFVVCDEFTHWSDDALWNSSFSSYEKRQGVLIILCNAGVGRDFKWRVREHAAQSPLWHFSAPDGVLAPWISAEGIAEQRACLPPTEFDRVWMNRWQDTGGEFVTLAEAEACVDREARELDGTPVDGWRFVASLDYAEKRDRTVGCVVHQEGDRIVVDRMDVVCPKCTKETTRVEWVENWMKNVNRRFGGRNGRVYFVLDEYQLLSTIQRLEGEYDITRFQFASGDGNWRMGLALRSLVIHRRLRWYPGCGRIADRNGNVLTPYRDDLCTELASLIVKRYASGAKWRFDHREDGTSHDDRAYALGAACLTLVENSGGFEQWSVAPGAMAAFAGGAA